MERVCDEEAGTHVWAEPFTDGDMCACGKFYLDLHPASGAPAEVQETPEPEE